MSISLSPASFGELIDQCVEGKKEALDKLVRLMTRPLWKWVKTQATRKGYKDEALVDDVCGDVWKRLATPEEGLLPAYRDRQEALQAALEPHSFLLFLDRFARSCFRNHTRGETRRRKREEEGARPESFVEEEEFSERSWSLFLDWLRKEVPPGLREALERNLGGVEKHGLNCGRSRARIWQQDCRFRKWLNHQVEAGLPLPGVWEEQVFQKVGAWGTSGILENPGPSVKC